MTPQTRDNLKFVAAILLSSLSLCLLAVGAVLCREVMGDTVTEVLVGIVPLGSLGITIVVILLLMAVREAKVVARHDNRLPKRRMR